MDLTKPFERKLLRNFHKAFLFMKDRMDSGEFSRSSANFLREYVRCTGIPFSNSRSPEILRELLVQHPELRKYIETKSLKSEREND